MTAETNVVEGVSDGSKVELEGKSGVDLSSGIDLANAGVDCNIDTGIADGKEEEFGKEAKEETDGSYVFVNGGSDDPEVQDPDVVDLKKKSIEEGTDEPELNAGSLREQVVVEFEELKEERGEICVGSGCVVAESAVSGGDHDELREEKGENGESCLKNGCFVEGSDVSLSVDGSQDDVQANDVADGEESRESQIKVMEGVESELNVSSLSKQTVVELEELKEEKGERGQSFVGNGCIAEESVISNGAGSEELREKGEGGGSFVENGCFVENGVTLIVDGSHGEPIKDDAVTMVEAEELREEKGEIGESKMDGSCALEENKVSRSVESDQLKEDNGGNDESCVENHSFVGESSVSSSVTFIIDRSHDKPIKDDAVTMVEAEELKEEQGEIGEIKVGDSCAVEENKVSRGVESEQLREENGENGESCVENHSSVGESGVSSSVDGSHDKSSEDDVEGNDTVEGKESELVAEVEENEKSQNMGVNCVESEELHPVEKGNETSSVDDELSVKESKVELGMEQELNPETAGCSVGDEKVETEVGDCPVEVAESHGEVTNGFVVTDELKNEVRDVSGESGMEEIENGSVEVVESMLACPDEVLNPEVEITNVSDGAGKAMAPCSVDNFGLESQVRHACLESIENITVCSINDPGLGSEVRTVSIENGRELPISPVNDMEPEGKVENGSAVGGTNLSAHQVHELNSENENINGHVETVESLTVHPVNEESELEAKNNDHVGVATNGYIESSEISVTCPADDLKLEAKITNCHCEGGESMPSCPIDEDFEAKLRKDLESGHSLAPCPPVNEDSEAAVQKDEVALESEVKIDLVEISESAPECVANVGDADNEEQSKHRNDDDERIACEEVKAGEVILSDGVLKSSQEDASGAALDEMKVDVESGKRLPNFIIKIPRYADDGFREQIKIAQLQVEERTQHRDSIRVAMQQQKATCNEYWENFEAARMEERDARHAVAAKRQEIDSVQLVISRMKNANSIGEIEERIHNMEHMIEHETMPLTEEKQLIREIKQLKHAREQLCANSGTQAEIQEAFDQKDSIEERFKLLKKELDSLRSEVQRTEGITKVAKKKHYDECEKLKELQAQFRDADNFRQEAYAHLQELKKQSYEKNKYFRMYKDDERIAADYASRGDREALQRHCANQVEKTMELWNNNDEFRKDYVKHNMMSTLRRLKTLDGRSLGPDEEPPLLRNLIEKRTDAARLSSTERVTSLVASASAMKEEKPIVPVSLEESVVKVEAEQKNLAARSKKTAKPTSTETVSVTVPSRVEVVEETEKESKQTKEEEEKAKKAEELARKEEELRKEEAAAKLREQRRLEEKAKAEAAEERKRRNAEKAQARAELRAKKEAELKEKEREKRMKKKDRKKAAAAGMMSGVIEGVPAEKSENSQPEATQEPEIKEKPSKRTPKPLPATKQSKTKPLPPPLRSRGKRKMQSWMWVLLIAVLLLALFFVGNNISFKFSLPSIGF